MSKTITRSDPAPNGAQSGQGMAEYALILALIAILAILALIFLGTSITALLDGVGRQV